ncbi:LPS export ABC transporter periplasmic protein LptC [Allorhizobium sonneratiae]|uniref:LPS export ABC transporter periplasmic protein LptC n=1 Tax=Allorhizobium sonneratiae TaxID=2934936 RepID=UPI003B84705D
MLNRLDHGAHEPPPQDKTYRKAVGHSRRVRRLKIILPVTALVLSAAFVGVSIVRAYLPENIKIESARIEDGKVVMAKPALSGRNANGTVYSMVANEALQDIKNPNLITLEAIKANVPVNEKDMAHITAISGTYDRATDTMQLDKPFQVHISSGVDASFQSGQLDVKAGKLKTDKPVVIKTENSTILAQSMVMSDKGQNILLKGQVRLDIDPSAFKNQGN